MRAKRPSLLRTTSAYLEPASATFPLETSHKQAEALELASHVIKRSQSLPPWLSRESDDFPAKQVPLLARRLSDVALDIRPAGRRARTSETRYRALSEVVDTEAAYLQDLIVLKDVYFNALNFTSLHPSDKASIFRNIEELYAWHRSVHEAFTSIDEELKWRVSDGAAAEGKWDNSKVLAAIERVLDVFTEKVRPGLFQTLP